jgi:arylsulfatase A-like enzyme
VYKKIKEKINIIIILMDQFRNDARSCHDIFKKIGERGVLFSNVVTYAPHTVASLHAFFTGMYGPDNGVDGYLGSGRYDKKGCRSLAEYLRDAGYFVHGYTFSPILFPRAGFDELKVVPEEQEPGILSSHENELRRCFGSKRLFFSFLHYGEIHHEVVRNVIRKYGDFDEGYFGRLDENRKRYLGYARDAGCYLDKTVALIRSLDADQNTAVMVITDHGSGLGEKPGEKAYGIYTYDYSICTWIYMIYPKVFPAGREFKTQVRTIDVLPTILDLVGLRPSRRHKEIKGRSLFPVIRMEENEDRPAFSETGGAEGPHPSPYKSNVKCIRDKSWKLIYNLTTSKTELYDIRTDPGETNNLVLANPKKAEELWLKLAQFL